MSLKRAEDDGDPWNAGWNACLEEALAEIERLHTALTASEAVANENKPLAESWRQKCYDTQAKIERLRLVLLAAHKYLDGAQWWHGDHSRAVKDVLFILNTGLSMEKEDESVG